MLHCRISTHLVATNESVFVFYDSKIQTKNILALISFPSLPMLSSPKASVSPPPVEEDLVVMSEVHLGCPPDDSRSHISHFAVALPDAPDKGCSTQTAQFFDEDGDLILARRKKIPKIHFPVTIQHRIASSIQAVGLQLWRAELVLADFLLHTILNTPMDFSEFVAIELGAGTGLVGMLLGLYAKAIYLTDYDYEVLDNCIDNVHHNSSRLITCKTSVHVRKLDWRDSWPPKVENAWSQKRYSWSASEVEEAETASWILAADVVYSNELTDVFFNTLERLLAQGPDKVAYVALEKRYNFTLDDMDIVANGYSHFLSYLSNEGTIAAKDNNLTGKLIEVTEIPQYVRGYERGNDTEIWEIKYVEKKSFC